MVYDAGAHCQLTTMAKKLTGADLIEYVKQNEGLPTKELAEGAGYFTVLPDGSIQVNSKPFLESLGSATGLLTPQTLGRTTPIGRRGKSLAYNLKTNETSGNAVVTTGYLKQIGVEPGDRVTVEVVEEAGELVLKRWEGESEEDEMGVPAAKAHALV